MGVAICLRIISVRFFALQRHFSEKSAQVGSHHSEAIAMTTTPRDKLPGKYVF